MSPVGGGGGGVEGGVDSDFFYFRLPASSSDKNSGCIVGEVCPEMEFLNGVFSL
jgi:hypothetical protein